MQAQANGGAYPTWTCLRLKSEIGPLLLWASELWQRQKGDDVPTDVKGETCSELICKWAEENKLGEAWCNANKGAV